jgi:competence protein ComEA
MRANHHLPPPAPCVLAVLLFLVILVGREVFHSGSLPAFFTGKGQIIHVELTGAGLTPGVYQFNDGLALHDVIKLTQGLETMDLPADRVWSVPLSDGESFRIAKKDREIRLVHRGWMSAIRRMVMEIPLHPDRMSCSDWVALPGVGPALAQRIENDRQKNGDFGSLDGLNRVPGIGEKRLDQWRDFF